MGLTIHWNCRTDKEDNEEIQCLVHCMFERAKKLPSIEIADKVKFISGDDADFQKNKDPEMRWNLIQASSYVDVGDSFYHVYPLSTCFFWIYPGEGCETATFGLSKFPEFIETNNGEIIPTKLHKGWHWLSFCKTQYASNPDCGGVPNFLKCHITVIKMLDFIYEMGIEIEVNDEGHYWQNRKIDELAKKVSEWNLFVAGQLGALRSFLSEDLILESEIDKYPNAEYLEAEAMEEKK